MAQGQGKDKKAAPRASADKKAPTRATAPKPAAAQAAAPPAGPVCRAPKCRQPVRAKLYCRKHYIAWRRGKLGDHHRYKICGHEDCRKPRAQAGLCAQHAGKGAPAEGQAAAPPA